MGRVFGTGRSVEVLLPQSIPERWQLPFETFDFENMQNMGRRVLQASKSLAVVRYPFAQAISLDPKAEAAATVVSLTPQQLYFHAANANVFLSAIIACRGTPTPDSERVDGFQYTITAEHGQRKVQGPGTEGQDDNVFPVCYRRQTHPSQANRLPQSGVLARPAPLLGVSAQTTSAAYDTRSPKFYRRSGLPTQPTSLFPGAQSIELSTKVVNGSAARFLHRTDTMLIPIFLHTVRNPSPPCTHTILLGRLSSVSLSSPLSVVRAWKRAFEGSAVELHGQFMATWTIILERITLRNEATQWETCPESKTTCTWVRMESGGMQRFEGDADIETWLMADCEGMIWESWNQSLSSRNLVIVNEKMMP
ncbi:MAG: hypothetical protein ASARMPREDX12_000823 [Alectoria sarmentosa]|nr:MAG: hypothetical protein ASARMPREDX12_000823 [Alectoria sarmentosa]